MYSFREIYARNRETFRNYNTSEPNPVGKRYFLMFFSAALFAFLCSVPEQSVLRVIITVLGILSGFSFSVLFFLANSSEGLEVDIKTSIEDTIKIDRLRKLSEELFYNVAYFIGVTISVIVLAVILMLPNGRSIQLFSDAWLYAGSLVEIGVFSTISVSLIVNAVEFVSALIFWFILFESLLTILRVLKRIGFFFEEKIKMNAKPQKKG